MAIFRDPYLKYIFQGLKPIESRWSLQKRTPYQKVKEGDRIFLKLSGGLVKGQAEVSKVEYFAGLNETKVREILHQYHDELRIQQSFLQKCYNAKYLSLIWLKNIQRYDIKDEFGWRHIGQDAWIILKDDWKKDCITGVI